MKYALIVLGLIIALVLIARRQIRLNQRAEKVFALINDPAAFPSWRSKVRKVDLLPDQNGHRAFREIGGDGEILFEVDTVIPNQRLVTRIADRSLPFGGKWTFELLPAGGGTTLRITEDGEVYNPLFRFVSRFVIGHHASIDQYLRDVARHFGENAPSQLVQPRGVISVSVP
jgi:uncharacterized protein YndB with AHSA1/START domain